MSSYETALLFLLTNAKPIKLETIANIMKGCPRTSMARYTTVFLIILTALEILSDLNGPH
jgi:hypothetical protein